MCRAQYQLLIPPTTPTHHILLPTATHTDLSYLHSTLISHHNQQATRLPLFALLSAKKLLPLSTITQHKAYAAFDEKLIISARLPPRECTLVHRSHHTLSRVLESSCRWSTKSRYLTRARHSTAICCRPPPLNRCNTLLHPTPTSVSSLQPSPTHVVYSSTTGQSYHVAAPAPNNSTAPPRGLPPLLLYPTNPSAASFAPLTAVPMAMDTILVRVSYLFSWWSWERQYRFPLEVPSFASPHLSSYLTGAEWSASMQRLNAALTWPSAVQLVRLLSLVALLGSIVLMWSKKVRSQKAWTVLCWSCLLLSGVTFVLLTKMYAGRVRKRLLEAVEAEHVYYQNKTSHPRTGLLQSSWRMDGRWMIVSAPTTAPDHHHAYQLHYESASRHRWRRERC